MDSPKIPSHLPQTTQKQTKKHFSNHRDTPSLCRHVQHVWFPSANTQLGGPLVPHVFHNFSVQIVELVHCTPRTGSGLDKTFIHNTFRHPRFLATKADFGSSTTNWKECWKRKLYFFGSFCYSCWVSPRPTRKAALNFQWSRRILGGDFQFN